MDQQKHTQILEFLSLEIPWRAASNHTEVIEGEAKVVETRPPYITFLEQYLQNPGQHLILKAIKSLKREIIISMIREMAFMDPCYDAPIAVSNDIPYGKVFVDYRNSRIVINELQGISKFVDADGDRANIHLNSDLTKACLVKYPITSQPLILDVLDEMPEHTLKPLTKKMVKQVLKDNPKAELSAEDLKLAFLKKHFKVDVGIMTSLWNSYELFKSVGMDYDQKMEFLFNSHLDATGATLRSQDIEETGLKAARKESKDFEGPKIFGLHTGMVLNYPYAWALTSRSAVSSASGKEIDWVTRYNLPVLVDKIQNLNFVPTDFRKSKPSSDEYVPPKFVEWGLIGRLLNLGLLEYVEIPHAELPVPAVVLFMTDHNREIVGLTDIKRDKRKEGLTYAFLLAPVFDNRTIYNADGTVAEEAEGTWVHPMNHLAKVMSTVDTTVRASSEGEILTYFPSSMKEWLNPKRAIKVGWIQKALIKYCGIYGDPAPAEIVNGDLISISPTAETVIKNTVVIDYGKPCDHEEMWTIAKRAHAQQKFCLPGSKATNREVRKYVLSNDSGGTFADDKNNASIYRGACLRSQLLKSSRCERMTVAIVDFETSYGTPLITPTGIVKQLLDNAFLPRCFDTEEELERFASTLNPEEAGVELVADIVDYPRWDGSRRRCWVINPRSTIRIGKLIDAIGNKFMPLGISQAHAVVDYNDLTQNSDVDLIMPLKELIAKGTHIDFLEDAVEADLHYDGKIIKCMLTTRQFFRTGDASENIIGRHRKGRYSGMDGVPIRHAISKIIPDPQIKPNLDYVEALQSATIALMKKFNIVEANGQSSLSTPSVSSFKVIPPKKN